jgi:hypothetical protein
VLGLAEGLSYLSLTAGAIVLGLQVRCAEALELRGSETIELCCVETCTMNLGLAARSCCCALLRVFHVQWHRKA